MRRTVWMAGIAGLSVSLLAAGTARRAAAQCGGVTMLGTVESVSGNPFQAEVVTTPVPTRAAPNLLNLQHPELKPQLVARDGQGRVPRFGWMMRCSLGSENKWNKRAAATIRQ